MLRERRYRRQFGALAAAGATYRYYPQMRQIYRNAYQMGSDARRVYDGVVNQFNKTATKGGAAPLPSKIYKRQKRRRPKTKSNKKLSKEVSRIKKQVSDLKHSENASLGNMTYRQLQVWNQTCANNVQSISLYEISKPSNYETVLAQLKYYDPSVPGTLITASAATGTYQKNFLVKSIFSKLTFRNNYQSDADVTVYLCTPKSDSSISPSQAWTDGITTDAGNVTANTEINQYPTDYDVFRDLWTAKRAAHKILSPGQSFDVSHSISNVDYDPALYDEHSAQYQKRFKTAMWMVVLRGTLSHDTAVDDQLGLAQAGIDTYVQNTWNVQYDAGVNLSYVYLDTTLDTPTNGFVQSHQPIPDNVGYSVA